MGYCALLQEQYLLGLTVFLLCDVSGQHGKGGELGHGSHLISRHMIFLLFVLSGKHGSGNVRNDKKSQRAIDGKLKLGFDQL